MTDDTLTTAPAAGLRLPPWLQSSGARLALMMGGAASIVALMTGIWFWGQAPDYRVLFADYADRDGGAIVAALQQMNVPYKIAEGGGAILVPAPQVHDLRLKLASQGLPRGGNVGFELMENQKLGISQFLEQVNFQRALEGELARTIQSLATVQSARVHLALPKASVFLREQQKPTASVMLNLHPGRALESQQVGAIVHLVASSVPELPVANVTVVDQSGNLLSDSKKASQGNGLDPTQLKYVSEVQRSIAQRIESILTPIVGASNVRAEVSADIDFSTSEQAAESYRPNQTPETSAIRSQHSSESQSNGSGAASGVPGALSNQPPQPGTAPDPNAPPANGANPATPASAAPTSRQKDNTVNYEVDKTLRYTQQPMGGVRRLSVAVVVNHKQETDKNGKTRTRPLTDAEKTAITDLVREAMGYNKERGDTLNVVNSPFTLDAPVVEDLPLWKQPEARDLAREIGRYLLMAALIGWLYFGQLKPLLRRMREPKRATGAGDAADPTDPSNATGTASLTGQMLEPVLGDPAPQRQNDLENVRQIARDDPRVVANVVKRWVGAE